MQGDYLDRLDSDDFDSLDAVELAMALEAAPVDPPGADAAAADETLLVRNRPPQHPRGSSGAAAKPKD
jgi:hypothetical protein